MNTLQIQNDQQYKSVVENIPDPVVVIGLDHALLYMNKAARKLAKIQDADLHNYKCYQIFHNVEQPCTGDDHPCPLDHVLDSKEEIVLLHQHASRGDKVRTVEITAAPLFDRNGTMTGIIETLRDVTAQRKKIRELEVVVTLTSYLRNARTSSEIHAGITKTAISLVGADGAAIALQQAGSNTYKIVHTYGCWKDREGSLLTSEQAILNDVIENGNPYIGSSFDVLPMLPLQGQTNIPYAVACIPLISQKQTIGILCIRRKSQIAEEEVWTLTAIADIAASAILRATLHQQTQQRLERLAALRAIDMAISSSIDLRVTLDVFLDQVTSKLGVDAAAVMLMNSYDHILEYSAGRGFLTTAIQSTKLRIGEGIGGMAALRSKTIKISDLNKDPQGFSRMAMARNEHFVTYFVVPLISKGHVKGILEVYHRSLLEPDDEWLGFLDALAVQAAIAIDNAMLFSNLHRSNIDLVLAYDSTLIGWAQALEMRDKVTEGHTRRVTDLTVKIAKDMNMSEQELSDVRRGAIIHDIGKLGIPDSILLKPGPLNNEEWEIMRQHPIYAYQMLSSIDYLRTALHIPLCHHEKWNGKGYPHGLRSTQIPLAARIFSVIDVWDALLSDRPYRAAWERDKVVEYIKDHAGIDFDPQVVDIFLDIQSIETGYHS